MLKLTFLTEPPINPQPYRNWSPNYSVLGFFLENSSNFLRFSRGKNWSLKTSRPMSGEGWPGKIGKVKITYQAASEKSAYCHSR
jgi:hypothetical protein